MRAVRRPLVPIALLTILRCAAPAPAPTPAPEPAPVQTAAPAPAKTLGTVRVDASALNVRKEASTNGEVLAQVKRGEALTLLEEGESWSKVRLANGETGYVSSRFLSRDGAPATTPKTAAKAKPRKGGCPADSDYAFVETPMLSFSDSSAHGLVIVEATVSAKGDVQSTKVVTNNTGDPALAFLAEREIRKAKFSPPIRNCVARSFIFTYRRTF